MNFNSENFEAKTREHFSKVRRQIKMHKYELKKRLDELSIELIEKLNKEEEEIL